MNEKKEFDQTIYRGQLIREDLLGAIAYLPEFPDKRDLVERYAALSMAEEPSSAVQTRKTGKMPTVMPPMSSWSSYPGKSSRKTLFWTLTGGMAEKML